MDLSVLIVDDSQLMCEMAKDYIIKSSVATEIHTKHNGQEAIEYIETHPVDLLVLDIVMPEMLGSEVMAYLHEQGWLSKMKVIIFTSLSEEQSLKGFFEMGAFDYITKPVKEQEFISRVKNALNQQALQKKLYQTISVIQEQNQELEDLNQQLKTSQMMIIQQEQLAGIGHLAAGVAHEINNPLGYIISNVNILKEYVEKISKWHNKANQLVASLTEPHEIDVAIDWNKKIEESTKSFSALKTEMDIDFVLEDLNDLLGDTLHGLERVSKIVKGMRQFSRIDVAQEFESYNLNDGIENTLMVAQNEIKYAAKVHLELGKIPEIPAVGSEINQTLLNLIINAVSTIRERRFPELGNVFIKTYLEESYVCCVVKDDGMGIEEKNIKDIFKPFYTTKPVGEGTGLGLSISHDIIVNKHKGILDVQSEVGLGTTMIIKLPVER